MPIPTGIENLSTTPASNNPAGSENVSEGDDHLRNLYAFLRQSFTAGADIASASTITPPSTGGSFNLTGTTTVTAIATTNSWSGRKIRFRHTGAHSFTQSASLVCPGGVSIAFANGDISEWAQNPSGGWEIVTYVPVLYISAPYFNATGTTIPAVGIYRPSANTLGFSSNTTQWATLNSTGNWNFGVASSGVTVTINGSTTSAIDTLFMTTSSTGTAQATLSNTNAGASAYTYMRVGNDTSSNAGVLRNSSTNATVGGVSSLALWNGDNAPACIGTNGVVRLSVAGAGNVTINAPTSGNTLTLTGIAGAVPLALTAVANTNALSLTDGTCLSRLYTNAANGIVFGTTSNHNVVLGANSASTITLTGTPLAQYNDGTTNAEIGWRGLPSLTFTGTLLNVHRGRMMFLSGGVTVPTGIFAAGDIVILNNFGGGAQTVTQGASVTLQLAGTASTGNRTVAANGICTLLFASGTQCSAYGPGVT